MVVVFTAWLNTKTLSAKVEAVQAEIRALRSATKRALRISELSRRVERIEEQRGLVRP